MLSSKVHLFRPELFRGKSSIGFEDLLKSVVEPKPDNLAASLTVVLGSVSNMFFYYLDSLFRDEFCKSLADFSLEKS